MQTYILYNKASVKLERDAALWLPASIMFPCGVNSVPNKLALIKGVVGAEIPAWVYSAPNFPLWVLPTPHVAICE